MSTTVDDAAFDRRTREAIAGSIRHQGVVPTIAQVAKNLGDDLAAVRASFDRMIAEHMFIPKRGSSEIYAYDPFCAERTDFRVWSDDREWWALCGWDALGIPAALGAAGTVESSCADCGEPIVIEVDRNGEAASSSSAVLHVGVPARDFWKDIYFT